MNVPFLSAIRKLSIHNLNTQNENIGRQRVPMFNASIRSKRVNGGPINKNKIIYSVNIIHYSINHVIEEARGRDSIFNKCPFKYIISFFHVQFHGHVAFINTSVLVKSVNRLIGQDNIVSDKPSRNEGNLVRLNDVV